MVEAFGGIVHDDGRPLLHGMGKAEYLSNAGRDLLLALGGVRRSVCGPDLVAVHVGDVQAIEVPVNADDAVLDPIGCERSPAPRANHSSAHGGGLSRLQFCHVYDSIAGLCEALGSRGSALLLCFRVCVREL